MPVIDKALSCKLAAQLNDSALLIKRTGIHGLGFVPAPEFGHVISDNDGELANHFQY